MNYESIQPLLDWISAHPHWSGLAVFFISLSESLAVVGLFVPGVIMMTAIGSLIGTGILPAGLTMLWAMLGAVAGDGISYWLGYYYKEHLRDFWPFRQFPSWLDRGQEFFQHHGGKSIVFGRFVGPVRPMIPVIAGMMHMSPRYFLWTNILSAVLWAPLYSLPGILIGASLGTLGPDIAKRVGLLILITLFLTWFLYVIVKKVFLSFMTTLHYTLRAIWQTWMRMPYGNTLKNYLTPKDAPENGQLGTLLLFFVSGIAFLWLLSFITHTIPSWDIYAYKLSRALYYKPFIDYTLMINGLGAPRVLLPVIAVIGLALACRRHWTASFCWLAGMGIFIGSGYILKYIVMHVRPDGLLHMTQEYSFPSGHTLTATLCFGTLAAITQINLKAAYRWIPWAISLPIITIIAFARLYLEQHWLSDILGSIAFGTLGACTIMLFLRRLAHTTINLTTLFVPTLLTFSISFPLYLYNDYRTLKDTIIPEWPLYVIQKDAWWQTVPPSLHYRDSIFSKKKTALNVQWVGDLKDLEEKLMKKGWITMPTLNPRNVVNLFTTKPSITAFPPLPQFHRDRLPVSVFVKAASSDEKERLLLQIWTSDYRSEKNQPFWVGSLQYEQIKRPWLLFGLITIYKKEIRPVPLEALQNELENSTTQIQTISPQSVGSEPLKILTVQSVESKIDRVLQ